MTGNKVTLILKLHLKRHSWEKSASFTETEINNDLNFSKFFWLSNLQAYFFELELNYEIKFYLS